MSYTTTTSTEEKNSKILRAEQILQTNLNHSKEYLIKIYNICLPYWNAILNTFEIFWQYPEFRLSVYIFGILSIVPAILFLLFLSFAIISTTILVGFIWTLLVFTALTFGLVILIPTLMGCFAISAVLVTGYAVYRYLLQLKSVNNKRESDD